MMAFLVVMAVWVLAVALFVLVGSELKRAEAAAESVTRRHITRRATSLGPLARTPARVGRVPSQAFCRRLS